MYLAHGTTLYDSVRWDYYGIFSNRVIVLTSNVRYVVMSRRGVICMFTGYRPGIESSVENNMIVAMGGVVKGAREIGDAADSTFHYMVRIICDTCGHYSGDCHCNGRHNLAVVECRIGQHVVSVVQMPFVRLLSDRRYYSISNYIVNIPSNVCGASVDNGEQIMMYYVYDDYLM